MLNGAALVQNDTFRDFLMWRIVGLFEDEEEAAGLIKFYNQYVRVLYLIFFIS